MVAIDLRTRVARPVVQHHGTSAAACDEGSIRCCKTPSLSKRRNCRDRHGPAVLFATGDSDCRCPVGVSAAPDDARRASAEGGLPRILRLRGVNTENYSAQIFAVGEGAFQPFADRRIKALQVVMRNHAPKDT